MLATWSQLEIEKVSITIKLIYLLNDYLKLTLWTLDLLRNPRYFTSNKTSSKVSQLGGISLGLKTSCKYGAAA